MSFSPWIFNAFGSEFVRYLNLPHKTQYDESTYPFLELPDPQNKCVLAYKTQSMFAKLRAYLNELSLNCFNNANSYSLPPRLDLSLGQVFIFSNQNNDTDKSYAKRLIPHSNSPYECIKYTQSQVYEFSEAQKVLQEGDESSRTCPLRKVNGEACGLVGKKKASSHWRSHQGK